MTVDSPEYFARIAEIRATLNAPPKGTGSFFAQKPRIELVTVPTVKRHWIFWEKPSTVKGIKLLTDMIYWSAEINDWVIELAGVTADGASVPQFLWSLFPPFGGGQGKDYVYASIGHDKYCRQGHKGISPIDYEQAAGLFREMMRVEHVRKRVWRTMYRTVLWFGPKFRAQSQKVDYPGRGVT